MICEIISVGTELLLGNIINTNAQYLSQKISELGFDVYYHSVVGDNMERLIEQIKLSRSRADIIITTGGLGPTDDDITKSGLCSALGIDLVLHKESLEKINSYFSKTGKEMPDINIRQAYIPSGGKIIENNNGSAPGVIYEDKKNIFILLPGPPGEMKPMFDKNVFPYLKDKSNSIIESKTLKVVGIGESSLQVMLQDLLDNQTNPTIALYAKVGEVHVRVTAKTDKKSEADYIINKMIERIKDILGDNIYGYDDDTLEGTINKLLKKNKKSIAIAESCTGGLVSDRLTNISGASDSYINGIVSYNNEAKIKILRVKEDTINKHGAVSKETAAEMAAGVKDISKTDIGLSITGIAGPDGGTAEKPIGLCYIGLAFKNDVYTYEFYFNGNRIKIKSNASTKALDILRRFLINLP
ncbi:MAG: competence/damage-inducible protein A [Firmicutes bacterium]|nr:competence/damage-inducible protein A [Bacillota bacterium]